MVDYLIEMQKTQTSAFNISTDIDNELQESGSSETEELEIDGEEERTQKLQNEIDKYAE